MQREYKLFLKDILDNIAKIDTFIGSLNYEEFKKDEKTVYAVTKSLEIIAEATQQIPEEVQNKYSYIPWRKIKNFRNLIVHKYWGIDKEIVWDILKNHLKPLKTNIKKILKE